MWIYYRYGREEIADMHHGEHSNTTSPEGALDTQPAEHHDGHNMNAHHMDMKDMPLDHEMHHHMDHEMHDNMDHGLHQMQHHQMDQSEPDKNTNNDMSNHNSKTPLYISVALSVCHCGAGCVLGDIVGEWIVYTSNVQINGRSLWPEMLIGCNPAPDN
jgi:Domain of unknown function (DUF4396)